MPVMVAELAIYTVVHQPRRLKLPAQPIPQGASIEDIAHCLFDERLNERYFKKVARYSYYPATRMFLDLVRHKDLHLSIGFSLSFIRQAAVWDPELLDLFRELVAEPHVELIGVEPYHSFLFFLDLPTFVLRMRWMAEELERIFGKRPVVTDTTEMCMSASLYDALDTAGFRGAVMDGRPWVLGWRESTHLYRHSDEVFYPFVLDEQKKTRSRRMPRKLVSDTERDSGPYLLTRHVELSDDVGYRFSNHGWSGYPLFADTYAEWLASTRGDFLFLGWDFETFGEHHNADTGIFSFMHALPDELARRGVKTYTPGTLIERHCSHVNHLPLPAFPTTWAGSGGMEFFMGNSAQDALFRLMGYVYGAAKLTENPDLIELAIWLAQSDNLHLIQWFERSGSEAEVSAYFTPQEWWSLGSNGIIHEQQQVYLNALHAMEPYLPTRLMRQSRRKNGHRTTRRTREPELSSMARHI
jgi:alpha-amylase